MNRYKNAMKKGLLGLLAMGVMAGLVGKAQAYTDAFPANNTAQITITITPNVDRSVTITTDTVGMLDLGNVSLGAYVSTQTVSPATVTVQGTIGNTDLLLSANITSPGGSPWSFDADSTTVESDAIASWLTLTSVSSVTVPSQSYEYFNGTAAGASSDLVDGSYTRIGDGATLNGRFENAITNTNNLGTGTTQRHMWFFFRMPSATTNANPQKLTYILTVDQGL